VGTYNAAYYSFSWSRLYAHLKSIERPNKFVSLWALFLPILVLFIKIFLPITFTWVLLPFCIFIPIYIYHYVYSLHNWGFTRTPVRTLIFVALVWTGVIYGLDYLMPFSVRFNLIYNICIIASIFGLLWGLEPRQENPEKPIVNFLLATIAAFFFGLSLWFVIPSASYWGFIAFWMLAFLLAGGIRLLRSYLLSVLIGTKLPRPLSPFLNEMAESKILRPMGGGFVFLHDYLRQNFLLENQVSSKQVELLIEDLDHRDNHEYTIEALVRFGDVVIIPLINTILLKPFGNQREAALRILIQIGEPSVEPLITLLNDTKIHENIREDVAYALGKLGDSRAVKPLIIAWERDGDYYSVRTRAFEGLVNIRSNDVISYLILSLKSDEREIRHKAVQALEEIGKKIALDVKPLIEALKTERHPHIRADLANLIVEIGIDSTELLISALDTSYSKIIEYASRKIGEEKDVSTIIPLIAALTNTETEYREGIAWALGEIGDRSAVKPLIDSLKNADWNWNLCSSAAEALGKLEDTQAISPLIEVIKDSVIASKRSLRMGPSALRPVVGTYNAALGALLKICKSSNPSLIGWLDDESADVRIAILKVLGQMQEESAILPIAKLLTDNSQSEFFPMPKVCDIASEALRKIATPEAIQILKEAGFEAG
jgi:HEAT repeat protein